MLKSEVIAEVIPTNTYLGSHVRSLINKVTCEDATKPTHLKKHDVITTYAGVKSRPAVIVKVFKDFVAAIPLTTGNSVHCLSESKSRFFRDGCFCNMYVIVPLDVAMENFIGMYDNPKLVNTAIKNLKEFINSKVFV